MIDTDSKYKVALSADQLVYNEPIMNRIDIIRSLVSLPKDHFELFYLDPIIHFSSYMQYYDENILQNKLNITITALKIRRSYILPKDTPSENINKVKDLWTYAVFTASLMYDAHVFIDKVVLLKLNPTHATKKHILSNPILNSHQYKIIGDMKTTIHFNPVLLTVIFNRSCLAWISQDIEVLNTILKIISNSTESTQIDEIIQQCYTMKPDMHADIIPTNTQPNDLDDEIDLLSKDQPILSNDASLLFFNWLKDAAITNNNDLLKNVKINTSNGVAFIIPDVFKVYSSINNIDDNEIQEQFMSAPTYKKYIHTMTIPAQGKVIVILI